MHVNYMAWSLSHYLTMTFLPPQGDHVWLETQTNSEFNVPIGAVVKDSDSGRILLEDDEGKVGYATTFCRR